MVRRICFSFFLLYDNDTTIKCANVFRLKLGFLRFASRKELSAIKRKWNSSENARQFMYLINAFSENLPKLPRREIFLSSQPRGSIRVSRLRAELRIIIDPIRRRCWFVYFTLKALTRTFSQYLIMCFYISREVDVNTVMMEGRKKEANKLENIFDIVWSTKLWCFSFLSMSQSKKRLGNHWHSTVCFSLADWLISNCVTKQILLSYWQRLFSSLMP